MSKHSTSDPTIQKLAKQIEAEENEKLEKQKKERAQLNKKNREATSDLFADFLGSIPEKALIEPAMFQRVKLPNGNLILVDKYMKKMAANAVKSVERFATQAEYNIAIESFLRASIAYLASHVVITYDVAYHGKRKQAIADAQAEHDSKRADEITIS